MLRTVVTHTIITTGVLEGKTWTSSIGKGNDDKNGLMKEATDEISNELNDGELDHKKIYLKNTFRETWRPHKSFAKICSGS